jgi:NAD(P)-dependent dehydrogenase (short-subunit alcohol dehydrogenase family)
VDRNKPMNSVVVTGASTGIGWATTKTLVAKGFRVFAGVRSETDAARLSAEFGANVTPLTFDVTDTDAVTRAAATVAAALGAQTLTGLVNNAGIAVPGPLLHLRIADLRRQLEVNLIGQLAVTQAFAPILGTDPQRTGDKGRIVMMSSVADRGAFPFNGPYSTSKSALDRLSEALRRELMLFGIDVIVVAPGPIDTPIWDKAEAVDLTPFAATAYAAALGKTRQLMLTMGRHGLPAERIGAVVAEVLTARRPRTRYVITPTPFQYALSRILPKRMIDRMIARRLGLVRA